MKKVKYIIGLFLTLAFFAGCDEENYEFGDIIAPSNLQVTAEIAGADTENPFGDGSGIVHFKAKADNVITYKYLYNESESMVPSGEKTYSFGNTGTHKYTVTVMALGTAGVISTKSVEVEVLVLYAPPADLITMLTGDSEKTWRIKAEGGGHFGVGPADETAPIWWGANPYDKEGLGAYDDRFIFNVDGTFTHITNGDTYGKADPMTTDLNGDQGLTPNSDSEFVNYPFDDYSESWSLSAPGGQETLTFSNIGYHGFYVGGDHSYAILARSETELSLRTVGADGLGWFVILTSEEEVDNGNSVDVVYSDLVWSDEFDTDGQPSTDNWGYDIGTGNSGWGNNESQYYTDRADNVTISEGTLKIIAKKESYSGSDYTSARIKTQGLFDFKYGRIDVRAKLPEGGGTWPAIWMLGSNFETVGWPASGEIDIMEHAGNNFGVIVGSIHTNSSSGATENSGTKPLGDATSAFHIYSVNWSENEISFLVDDEIYYTYKPEVKDGDTWPFDANQFIILNLAMGGNFGGEIEAAFTEGTMEVDYVRVYQ